MANGIEFLLSYTGNSADSNEIDLYDVAKALHGFQRTLALTTHLILNDEIITHATALKGAKIYTFPAEEGSWNINSSIVITSLFAFGMAQSNSPIGHLAFSIYDYVISESLGFHVDYNKSIGQLIEENKAKKTPLPNIKQYQADSLIEKCENAIIEMHRPIYVSKTATTAHIYSIATPQARRPKIKTPIKAPLTLESYNFISDTRTSDKPEKFKGKISSYNSNTFKGRIYIADFGRPIPFELSEKIRTEATIRLITESLSINAIDHSDNSSIIYCLAYTVTTKKGHLKGIKIIDVSSS